MALRRSLQHALHRLLQPSASEAAALAERRGYARVAGDALEGGRTAARFPARRQPQPPQGSSAAASAEAPAAAGAPAAAAEAGVEAAAAPGGAAGQSSTAAAAAAGPALGTTESIVGETQRESARVATAFMFPWERRQMEGGKLKTWEKAYWGVFAVGMSIFLFNRLRGTSYFEKEKPKVDEDKERRKEERARLALAGGSFVEGEEDVFRGMSPREIQAYVERVTGARSDDPFEGMSPEEINEYVAKHGAPAGM